jgi:hypothetical protein
MNQQAGAASDFVPPGNFGARPPAGGPSAATFRGRPVAIDLVFIAGLLAISAVPLVLLRGSAFLHGEGVLAGIFAGWVAWVALWTIVVRQPGVAPASLAKVDIFRGGGHAPRLRLLLAAALLLAFVVAAFFFPLRLHFWGGYDEVASLRHDWVAIWSDKLDTFLGRPLLGMPTFIAAHLTPDRIEGVLYVALGLCFLNALLLLSIIGRLLPGGVLIGMAAAVLFVVNRSEPLLFFVAWATNFYWMALVWFLLSLYLLLVSHARGSRWLLAASCASLGAALLTSEGLFPLTLIGPLLLRFQSREPRELMIWTSAWLGTAALLAARFSVHFLGGTTYQGGIFSSAHYHYSDVLLHMGRLMLAVGSYFRVPPSIPEHWGLWLLAIALAAAAAGSVQDLALRIRPGTCIAGMATAAVAGILAVAPFAPLMAGLRTQYFAGAAQAVFVAFAVALLVSLMPQRFARAAAVSLVALIAANAAAEAWLSQESRKTNVRFEKTVHVFRQIHAIAPNLPNDTLLLFFLDDPADTPLGVNYHVASMSEIVLGVTAMQVNVPDSHGVTATLGASDVDVEFQRGSSVHYRYEQVVAFRLSEDGTLELLDELPGNPSAAVTGYQPLARLRPGPIDEPRFMRYPAWSEKAVDVFDVESGIIFGRNWQRQFDADGQVARWADNDAELIVNPAGAGSRKLRFQIEPGPEVPRRPLEVVVLASSEEVLGTAPLQDVRQQVNLEVKLDPDRTAFLRLRVRDAVDRQALPGSFRVFPAEPARAARWQRSSAADIIDPSDRLHLGRNWHPFESFAGESFRWVENDAEILLDVAPGASAVVRLEVEPGPSLGGKPADLSFIAEDGTVLAGAAVTGRTRLDIMLPPAAQRRRVLRLHAKGGGLSIPNDSRILNFRVFRCWRPVDAGDPARDRGSGRLRARE